MPRFLVTGATGFAGSHIVEEILTDDDNSVVTLDRMKHVGRLDRLAHLDAGSRLKVVNHDLGEALTDDVLSRLGIVDYVIHNAAESHVSRSFVDPGAFIRSNVTGTMNILEAVRRLQPKKLVYVSTDEVFGPANGRPHKPDDALQPTNPYAATKAAGEYLARSYRRSFGVPVVITRTSNMFGERQNPEKFVPMVIRRLLCGELVDIHASSSGVIGSRQWTYVGEQAQGLTFLAKNGVSGEAYHICSGKVMSNLDVAQLIADMLGVKLNHRLVVSDRFVHDLHYSTNESMLSDNWKMNLSLDELMRKTVRWYCSHTSFLGL